MKKITFFTYQMIEYGGGVATYFLDIAPELQKRLPDVEISIVTFNERLLRKVLFFYTLYFGGKQDQLSSFKESSKTVSKKLEKISYKKVNSFSELFTFLSAQDSIYTTNNFLELIVMKLFHIFHNDIKIIIGFHIPLLYTIPTTLQTRLHNILYTSFIYRSLLKSGATLQTLNRFSYQMVKKIFPQKNVVLLYTPVFFPSKRLQKKKQRIFTILWVGRLTEQKGVKKLIEIINMVNLVSMDKVQWFIVGDGELRNNIEEIVKRYNNVHYLGYIPNSNLPDFYKSADLFIMTSISESYPYTLLEAQHFSLFSIAFTIPGCEDMIESGKSGYLVKSTKEFSMKILKSIEHKPTYITSITMTNKEKWDALSKLFI